MNEYAPVHPISGMPSGGSAAMQAGGEQFQAPAAAGLRLRLPSASVIIGLVISGAILILP